MFACRLIAILHDEVRHDCPLDYASLAHLGPIVPTLKGRRIVGSGLAWHQKYLVIRGARLILLSFLNWPLFSIFIIGLLAYEEIILYSAKYAGLERATQLPAVS